MERSVKYFTGGLKLKKSYWQAFSYAGDSIHEAFFHLGSVHLESTVADALE